MVITIALYVLAWRPMAAPHLAAQAVHRAIDEYDRLGADSFLEKTGTVTPRSTLSLWKIADTTKKAIAGVAHRYGDALQVTASGQQVFRAVVRDPEDPMSRTLVARQLDMPLTELTLTNLQIPEREATR